MFLAHSYCIYLSNTAFSLQLSIAARILTAAPSPRLSVLTQALTDCTCQFPVRRREPPAAGPDTRARTVSATRPCWSEKRGLGFPPFRPRGWRSVPGSLGYKNNTVFAWCSFKWSRENRWISYRIFPETVYQPVVILPLPHSPCWHTHTHPYTLTHTPLHILTLS